MDIPHRQEATTFGVRFAPSVARQCPPLVSSVAEGQIYGTRHGNQNTLTWTESTLYICLSKIQAVVHNMGFSYYEPVTHAVTIVLLRFTWQGGRLHNFSLNPSTETNDHEQHESSKRELFLVRYWCNTKFRGS